MDPLDLDLPQRPCYTCAGTGTRTTLPADSADWTPESWVAWMRECNGCNGCGGTGLVVDSSTPEYLAFCYRKRPEDAAVLPVDLDGNRYRIDEIGPWKVTSCCGAYIKGVENGVVCRSCFDRMDGFPDGPARLSESDPVVRPASETAIRITLPARQ